MSSDAPFRTAVLHAPQRARSLPRRRPSVAAIVAAAFAGALVMLVAVLLVTERSGSDRDTTAATDTAPGDSDRVSPESSAGATPTPSDNAVPANIIGKWTGSVTSPGLGRFQVDIDLPGGRVGAVVGSFRQDVCSGTLTLQSRNPTRLLAQATSNPLQLCAETTSVTMTPLAGGALRYEMSVVNAPAGGGILRPA